MTSPLLLLEETQDKKKKSTYDDEHTIPLEQHDEETLKTDFTVGLTKSEAEKGWKSLAKIARPPHT